jgi:hypothetical protein
MSGLRPATPLLLALLLSAPGAAAWTLGLPGTEPPAPAVSQPQAAADWAWTFGMARSVAAGMPAAVTGAAACALGDVNADGVGDLVVQVKDATGGGTHLTALAGPRFQTALWTTASSATRVLECAPGLGADHVADPILRTVGAATAGAAQAAGAADFSAQQVLQVLDGATGTALMGRSHLDAATGSAQSVAGAALGVGQSATATLLPAAAGAEAFLRTTVKQASAASGLAALPVGALTSTVQATAHLDVLDAAGAVVASVNLDQAGQLPLALAPLPLSGKLPDVAALTMQAASPVEQAAGNLPTLALYAADGTLAWSRSLAPTTGVPLLVPRAGDLNLDGVPDLIVTTVQQGVQTAPAAAFQVLSGLDGSTLLSSGAAVNGLVAALPLGHLPAGPALLKVQRLAGEASTTLSALDATGRQIWSAQVSSLARPVNQVLDPYTGDVLGFTDLTKDGVPDVAVAVQQGTSLALQALDGATGKLAWAATIPDATSALPLALSAAGQARGQVLAAASGAPAHLLAIGGSATAPVVTLVDAASGKVAWTAHLALQAGRSAANVTAQAAGDLNADGIQDVLVTVPSATGAPSTVVALSGATGTALWSASTDAAQALPGVQVTAQPGPAPVVLPASQAAATVKAGAAPLAPAVLALALVAAAGRRLRRAA